MAIMKENIGSLKEYFIYIALLLCIVAAAFYIISQLDIDIEIFASWHMALK